MSRWRGLDGSSAALRLVVGSVVRPGLHLNTQLVLVELGRQRPVEWRQGVGPAGGWDGMGLTIDLQGGGFFF